MFILPNVFADFLTPVNGVPADPCFGMLHCLGITVFHFSFFILKKKDFWCYIPDFNILHFIESKTSSIVDTSLFDVTQRKIRYYLHYDSLWL